MWLKTSLIYVFLLFRSAYVVVSTQNQICYEGTFSKKDVIRGSHMVGVSFRNITSVPVPQTCFSACTNECRCKAFQLQEQNCELLEEDRHSESAKFALNPSYDYYDLHQDISSRVSPQATCRNGCCEIQPCLIGEVCVEHCENPKVKFTCHKLSCREVQRGFQASGKTPQDGTFNLSTAAGRVFPAYCSFTGTTSWTLIESFAYKYRSDFQWRTFHLSAPFNEMAPPSWEKYRMPRDLMEYVYTDAIFFKAECNYEKAATPAQREQNDHAFGRVARWNILNVERVEGLCVIFDKLRVRGHACTSCSISAWHNNGGLKDHPHLDTTSVSCSWKPPGGFPSEDNFGYYGTPNTAHTCITGDESTTSWWFGHENSP